MILPYLASKVPTGLSHLASIPRASWTGLALEGELLDRLPIGSGRLLGRSSMLADGWHVGLLALRLIGDREGLQARVAGVPAWGMVERGAPLIAASRTQAAKGRGVEPAARTVSHLADWSKTLALANKQTHPRTPRDEPRRQSSVESLSGCQAAVLHLLE